MSVDYFISKIPVIRSQSWGIIIKAIKRNAS